MTEYARFDELTPEGLRWNASRIETEAAMQADDDRAAGMRRHATMLYCAASLREGESEFPPHYSVDVEGLWSHYPVRRDGRCVWVSRDELTMQERDLIATTLRGIARLEFQHARELDDSDDN